MIDNGEYPNTKEGRKQAAGHCHSIYDEHGSVKSTVHIDSIDINGLQRISFQAKHFVKCSSMGFLNTIKVESVEMDGKSFDKVELVAAVGDMFYQNVYVPANVLEAVAKEWNTSIHDISHMATNYPAGFFQQENIEWVVGFHKESFYDSKIKGVRMNAYINKASPKYRAWRNYIDICSASGRIPNTSMMGWASFGMMDAKELPKGTKIPEGAKDDNGNVYYLKELHPVAVTTCLRGKCNDSDGCGVDIGNSCESCNTQPEETKDKDNQLSCDNSDEQTEYAQRLKKRLKQIDY